MVLLAVGKVAASTRSSFAKLKASITISSSIGKLNTAVSETKLILLKSKIDYTVDVYLLKKALGDKLY